MALCVDCLMQEKPNWLNRYLFGWAGLIAYGIGAFILAPAPIAMPLQAAFFTVVFPYTLWPLFAARRRRLKSN